MATQPTSLQALRKQVRDLQQLNQELRDHNARLSATLQSQVATKNRPALEVQVGGDHYKSMAIQPIEYILANNLPFTEGSIVKYVSRWREKGGIKDLQKVQHFAQLLIEDEQAKLEDAQGTDTDCVSSAENACSNSCKRPRCD